MKHDSIAIIEAAYDLAGDDLRWLERMVEAVRPSLDRGLGIIGYLFDASESNKLNTYGFTSSGADPRHVQLAKISNRTPFQQSNAAMNATYRSPRALRYASAALRRGRWGKEVRAASGAFGVTQTFADVLILNSTDPSLEGCIFAAPDPAPSKAALARSVRWSNVSAHIAAALRLRRRIRRASRSKARPEAVLSPTGQLLHAESAAKSGEARNFLRHAALAAERARGALRRSDPDEATRLWRGLVDGRWSLIDQFDSDGRRLIVAHRNDLQSRSPRKLTPRERDVVACAALAHSNKLIAYELGLSISAVGGYLAGALAKLGLDSRAQLVELVAHLSGRDAQGCAGADDG
jgi:DNA-binding CsgD family transcriptional regulator